MGADSKIEWTDHTFNPWWGCTKVSPGCDHCYAERMATRQGVAWGPGAPRRKASDAAWIHPPIWNRRAERLGIRARVFCASMADVFDNEVPEAWRDRLWRTIRDTPHLDWLLLTKRISNVARMVPEDWFAAFPPNVWLGISVVNQEEADRDIPKLLAVPACVRFLSCEPLLGPIDLVGGRHPTLHKRRGFLGYCCRRCRDRQEACACWFASDNAAERANYRGVDWVIAGGESGPGARPMHPDWARSLRDQCKAAGVPFFFKQWGEWAPHKVVAGGDLGGDVRAGRVTIVHPTGQTDVEVAEATGGRSTIPGSRYMARVGKKAAGRKLDGREWNEVPQVTQQQPVSPDQPHKERA